MGNLGFQHLACSVHVTNKRVSDGYPSRQAISAYEKRFWWEQAFNARPIVSGDFNLNYPHPGGGWSRLPDGIRNHWYFSDSEAVLLSWRATHGRDPGKMIDYQWADSPTWQGYGGSCTAFPRLSDHRFCIGNFGP